jgi:hypothetical protein
MLNRVLSRDYVSGGLNRDGGKQVGVLEANGITYSNFHQGAGEDATLDLVALLNAVPNQSMILLDEAEASLHPKAQRRLVTELVRLATEKRLQIVLTTHSPFILEQLPPVARVFMGVDRLGAREIIYGASATYSLSLMDDESHPELDVHCEDAEAAYLIEMMLSVDAEAMRGRIRTTPVGPADVVRTMGRLAIQSRLTQKSVAVLDGDQAASEGCLVLPGGDAPEKSVYRAVLASASWQIVGERLGVPAKDVSDATTDALNISNHHAWTAEIARQLSIVRPARVWEAFADVWVKDLLDTGSRKAFVKSIVTEMP